MAVTKIWDIKGNISYSLQYVSNPTKTQNPMYNEADLQALRDVLDYAMNEDKTEQRFFVTGINCNTTCAREQFITVKQSYNKEDGIIAFHGYQSFAPDETTPEMAHKIGVKLANELWGDRFQVIVATHTNTDCLHNHFLLNSVSFRDGKKYHDCNASYAKMRQVSDRLCLEYGLSVVKNPHRGSEPIYEAHMSKEGMPTRYNVARAAIDEAISKSCNMREFEHHLKTMGYATQFNHRRKYWTVTPKGWNKPIRLARLGTEYTNERICQRVMENPSSVRMQPFHHGGRKQYLLLARKDKINKVGGLRGLYLKYCYELGYLPKYKQNPNRVHYLLKVDLIRCELFTKQIRLLGRNKISDTTGLNLFIKEKQEHLSELSEQREHLRKVNRRVIPEDMKEANREKVSEITERMKHIRQELKLAEDIKKRAPVLEKRLVAMEEEKERGRKER